MHFYLSGRRGSRPITLIRPNHSRISGYVFPNIHLWKILWHNISSLVLRLIFKLSTLCSRNIDFLLVVHSLWYHHIDGISLGYFLIGLFLNIDISPLCGFAQLTMFSKIWMNDIWCILASICWFIVTSVKEAQ